MDAGLMFEAEMCFFSAMKSSRHASRQYSPQAVLVISHGRLLSLVLCSSSCGRTSGQTSVDPLVDLVRIARTQTSSTLATLLRARCEKMRLGRAAKNLRLAKFSTSSLTPILKL